MKVQDRVFQVEGLEIAARDWGGTGRPAIALHGWLDNAASFDRLAPKLSDCHLLALDLPGQGLSGHKAEHGTYLIWDDLLAILAVADEMGWEQFDLLAHSRGAMIALLLAASMPERVTGLCCIDGFLPPPVKAEDAVLQLRSFLHDNRRLAKRKMPDYDSVEAAAQARSKASAMEVQAALKIAERSTEERDGRWHWRNDSRLNTASAFKLTEEHNKAFVSALEAPTLLILAEGGFGRDEYGSMLEGYAALNSRVVVKYLKGGHHMHMNDEVDMIAEAINYWRDTNNEGKPND